MREQEGFEGVIVLANDDGKGMIVSLWETREAAEDASGFAAGELERYVALFRSPPGRDVYQVVQLESPQVLGA